MNLVWIAFGITMLAGPDGDAPHTRVVQNQYFRSAQECNAWAERMNMTIGSAKDDATGQIVLMQVYACGPEMVETMREKLDRLR